MISLGSMVTIIWQDPQTDSGWFEEPTYKLEYVSTVGYYIGIKDNVLCVATTYHKGTETFADEMLFPCGCVVSITPII